MMNGLGMLLAGLLSYPVMIGSAAVLILSAVLLLAGRRRLHTGLKAVLWVLIVLAVLILAWIAVATVLFAGNTTPPVPVPVPQ